MIFEKIINFFHHSKYNLKYEYFFILSQKIKISNDYSFKNYISFTNRYF